MYILGINFSHHTSLALMKDNKVLLHVLEERLVKRKHFRGLPKLALRLIKQYTDVVDVVVGVSGNQAKLDRCVEVLKRDGVHVKSSHLKNLSHHLFHGAAAFYMSKLDNASVLVVDGAGSMVPVNKNNRASETTSVYDVVFPNIWKPVYKKFTAGIYDQLIPGLNAHQINIDGLSGWPPNYTASDIERFRKMYSNVDTLEIDSRIDIGFKYAILTAMIGFRSAGEGKTMGLSAYHNSLEGGTLEDTPYSKLSAIQIAYKIQKECEASFLEKIKWCRNKNNLVFGGGCSLNILGNSVIKKALPDVNMYVDPVAMDGTLALGGAAYTFYTLTQCKDKMEYSIYSGPEYNITKDEVYSYVDSFNQGTTFKPAIEI